MAVRSRHDCLGRDLFDGHDPEAPGTPAEVAAAAPRSMRQFLRDHRRAVTLLAAVVLLGIFVLVVLPQVAGFGDTLGRLREGNKAWLGVAVAFEVVSIGGYVAGFRAVFSCHETRIGWRESYQINMAGLVATKFFSAAGAGGVALTVWALRAAGLSGRTVARRMASFEILLYAVYMGSLLLVGGGLALGVLPGRGPFALTILPAGFGTLVIALALAMRFLPEDVEARAVARLAAGRTRRIASRLATVPRTVREGMVTATELVAHPTPGLLGPAAYWAFDIGALWASFHAFGAAPPLAVVVMAYFVGTLANTIPIPGGVGGVEGGLIGSFIAFGVSGSDAVLAVLTYRAISYWLPLLPGSVAYFRLRRTVASWRREGERDEATGLVPA
jgi:uncharacterized protein (TIRG00374 family)